MKTKAAVVYEYGRPMVVEELDLDGPKEREVLVQFKYAGLCHSDLSIMKGSLPVYTLPCVLGHEGAGVVKEVGPGVKKVKPGDHVLMMWVPVCGQCYFCLRGEHNLCADRDKTRTGLMFDGSFRLRKGKEKVHFMGGVGCFSEYNVVSEQNVLPIEPDIPLDVAALFGCAVMTGIGAVINKARVRPGSRVAVVGIGGVGLSVIQGAVLANATKIIAVDTLANKLMAAREFGATDLINASKENPVERVKELTQGMGVDYAFEAVGTPETVLTAFQMIRRGGYLVVLGVPNPKATVTLPLIEIPFMEKSVLGTLYGSGDTRMGMKTLIDLYKAGRLKTEQMISARYSLDEINQGFEDMETGKNLRGVITY